MASQLTIEYCSSRHCRIAYESNSIAISVCVCDWMPDFTFIYSDDTQN